MKASMKLILAASAFSLSATSAFAFPANFIGLWKNTNPSSNGIVKIFITPGLTIRTFGACTPTLCDHGPRPLTTYGKNISDPNHRAGTAQYHFSFKEVVMTLKLVGSQRLHFEHFNQFTDSSGRQNYWKGENFKRVLPLESDNIIGDINDEISSEVSAMVDVNGERSNSKSDARETAE